MFSTRSKGYLSEFVGTYILVVLGPASVISTSFFSIPKFEAIALVALVFGGTVALVILGFGRFSGSLINPAITLAAASAKQLRVGLVVPYLFLQISGGILAGLTLRLVFSWLNDSANLGSTTLTSGISPMTGIGFEALGTFILASSALIASTRAARARYQALLVGGTLTILILFIGPFTGAGFNPARSLGPSLASGYFTNLYVYLVGPIAGAVVAGLLLRFIMHDVSSGVSGNF